MRSSRLLGNEKIGVALRSLWETSRVRCFGKTYVNTKKAESCEADPYEGNYSFLECDQYTKVTVIGAAGRVGRTLSLLLKTCPLIDHLCLFDTDKSVKGIGVDISHIDTKCCVSYTCGMRNIQQALDGPDVVIIAAGCPASPNLSGKKLFDKNAPIVAGISEACARFCPKACIVLITNPINSLLPVVGEVYQTLTNRIPTKKMFGLTTLDVVRANTFVAEVIRKDPNSIIVPIIGGTSQETIVPVISQMKPCCKIKRGEMIALTECIKRAEGNLVDCQNCGTRGASSLSTAYAAFRFTSSLVMALKGAEDIVECAFVKSDIIPELEYLASPLKLGIRGIEHNFGYPPLSDYELAGLELAAATLVTDIDLGKSFVRSIEETIREGLIWRRLTEDSSKGEKGQVVARKAKDSGVRKRRLEESGRKEESEEEAVPCIEKGVVYSAGWTAPSKTSLKKLLHPEEAPQEGIVTESIAAEVEGCRGDPSLHEKVLTKIKEEKKSDFPFTVSTFRPKSVFTDFVRNLHTIGRRMSSFEERNLRRKRNQELFQQYIMEDRKKVENHPKLELVSIPKLKVPKILSHDETPKLPWENESIQSYYKSLNLAAKQKLRSYNSQKRFNPSASVLLMLDRARREKAEKRLTAPVQKQMEKPVVESKNKEQMKEEEDEEEMEESDVKEEEPRRYDENAKRREYVMSQLSELKKENELLKKRLVEISKEKKLGTALQVQNDHLELERTKLKACWLIMTSTMDAFSNFCKRFISKGESKSLQDVVQEIETEEDNDVFEDAEEYPQQSTKHKPSPKDDDKYFQFLQKLMEDQMTSKKTCCCVGK